MATQSRPVRDFFVHNALYWLEEFHADGLRFDAVHAIADDSRPHILEELAAAIRNGPGRSRHVHLVLENDANQARYLRRATDGGAPLYDAQWNDDAHHAFHVVLTGESDGYYADYAGEPMRLLGRCAGGGFRVPGRALAASRGARPRGAERGTCHPPRSSRSCRHTTRSATGLSANALAALAEEPALRAATVAWLLAPGAAHAFHGRGVWRRYAVPVFLRLRRRACRGGPRRPAARIRAICALCRCSARDRDTGSERFRHLRPQQARLDIAQGARRMRAGLRSTGGSLRCAGNGSRRGSPA